jgi:hypothetical protein
MFQRRNFVVFYGNNQFPAFFVRYIMFLTGLVEKFSAFNTESCFKAVCGIINTGMYYFTVTA